MVEFNLFDRAMRDGEGKKKLIIRLVVVYRLTKQGCDIIIIFLILLTFSWGVQFFGGFLSDFCNLFLNLNFWQIGLCKFLLISI